MTNTQPKPASPMGQWTPVEPAATISTRILIDRRQANVWDAMHGHFTQVELVGDSAWQYCRGHWTAARDRIEALTMEPGDDEERISPEVIDMYGLTRHDVLLLAKAGTVEQPHPWEAVEKLWRPSRFGKSRMSGELAPGTTVLAAFGAMAGIMGGVGELAIAGAAAASVLGGVSVAQFRARKRKLRDVQVGPLLTKAYLPKGRTFTVGVNSRLAALGRELTDTATGLEDPLWTLYEQLTDLADEAAHRSKDAGPKERLTYEAGLGRLATRIERGIAERRREALEIEEIQRELAASSSDDDSAALGLSARLTTLDRSWDQILPETTEQPTASKDQQ